MLSDEQKNRIRRLYHAEGLAVATIARTLGVHHSSVRRAILRDGVPLTTLSTRKSKLDPFVPFMVDALERYPGITASRLFEMVRERGYSGRPDHFRAVVARYRKPKPAEAFLRRNTLRGEEAQVDWAHFGRIEIDGTSRMLVAFVLVLSWSRWAYLRFGVDMRIGSFLEHHQDAFTSLGGVPRVILYDNLKAAVAQRIADAIVFNADLEAFATHYGYEPRPVAPYRGNEKGRVERAIRHIRTSFFVGRTFRDLDDLNAQAEAWCREVRGELRHPDDRSLTIIRALDEEREVLRKLPADAFPVADKVEVAIGKTPYARFDGNDYSVPHDRVKKTLTVSATRDTVRIIDGGDVVATHTRSWGKGGQFEDASHIAALVSAKRKAAESHGMNRVFRAVPEAQEFVRRLAERGGNIGHAVVRLGELLDTYGPQKLSAAVVEATASNAPHIAGLLQILDREHPVVPQKVTLPDNLKMRDIVVRQAPLAAYDALKKDGPTS